MNASRHLFSLAIFAAVSLMALAPADSSAQTGYYAASYASGQQAAYQQQMAQQQAWAAYHHQQQQAAAAYAAQQQAAYAAAQQQRVQQALPVRAASVPAAGTLVRFDGRFASCSASLPSQVQYAINAANHLQSSPYTRGGGHGRVEDGAYDCSSSVSYALIKAGLLNAPLTSKSFTGFGEAGQGRFITVWVKPGEHVFMTICGLRLDTSGGAQGEGPRWRTKGRNMNGFIARHPFGL